MSETSLSAAARNHQLSAELDEAKAAVLQTLKNANSAHGAQAPQLGIVLGSGLGQLSERLQGKLVIPFDTIPHMPVPQVAGHAGALLFGRLGNKLVVCLSGRAHLYEGHAPAAVVFGVRLLARLGVQAVIVSNAAGGLNPAFAKGSLMLIEDHINFTGQNPLLGPNDSKLGERFPDMSECYSESLRALAKSCAAQLNIPLEQGNYIGVLGPSYETPLEIRLFAQWGASAVGMSTVHEVIALGHMKLPVLGISCITNLAAGLHQAATDSPATSSKRQLKHEDVAEEAARASGNFCDLVEKICAEWSAPD